MGAWEGRMLAWLSCQGPEALRGALIPGTGPPYWVLVLGPLNSPRICLT